MRLPSHRLVVWFGILSLVACNEPAGPAAANRLAVQASAGAPREVSEYVYDLNGSVVYVVCNDEIASEPIELRGKIVERATVTFTPSGTLIWTISIMPVGLGGTGVLSGADYKYQEWMHGAGHQSMSETGSFHTSFRLESKETGQKFRFTTRGNYTLNANGDVTVGREAATAICERG